jgi:hypothetical protein
MTNNNKEYLGYPSYVVITLPKQGTKTMNKCFTSLGYRVFDIGNVNDFAKEFDDYGKEKIEFAQLAKIWEENKFEVIIEPSALYWYEMVSHWPKTKFIHLFRDEASWKQSLKGFMTTLHGIPKGAIMDQLFYENPCMSPTANHALTTVVEGYSRYAAGHRRLFLSNNTSYDDSEPWDRMINRRHRLFHADVICNAPKDRTLFNYNVKDGWPKLREYLGLPASGGDSFPHENKGAQAQEFYQNIWAGSNFVEKSFKELEEFMKQNGYEIKKIEK